MTDAENHTSKFEYDPKNRRTAVIDASGYRTETQYSLRGDVLSVTNANNETIQFENDALGRKTAAIDSKNYRSEYQYDANGNLTCAIDANAQANLQPKNLQGCTESRAYDELNRVTQITDAQNNSTRFTYDLAGNRLTLTDAENKTSGFTYDDLGRLKSETDHLGLATTNKLDEAGNAYEQTNRLNEVTRVSFDNANRPTRVDYLKDNSAETFAYDPAGNRTAVANGTVSYSFQYDRANRLTQKTDSRGRSLSFSFDRVGNILTKTTYQGSTTSYLYNAANRLVQLRNPDYLQADYQYDPAGRLLSRVTSSGARTTYQYDANGGLTKLTQYDAANALISDTAYTRDRLGNILTQTDATGITTYSYDPLYRLQTADYPGAANDEAYSYDKVGNRLTKTQGSLIATANTRYYSYSAGTNRLSQIRIGSTTGAIESSFAHDLEGRLVSQTGVGAKTLVWDAKGRVRSVNTETYSYDAMDYRIGRSGGALGNLSYFLEGEHLESVYDAGGIKERYLRGSSIDELVAGYLKDIDGKTKPFLFHHDNANNVSQVTGHNGGVIQATTYSAFGQTASTTGASPSRLKYTGREDDGTGLYYYRARYYDPQIGRFISEDPMGFAAGDVNFYQYVGANPVNYNDPSGQILPAIAAGCAAFPVVCAAIIGAGTSVVAGGVIRGGVATATGQNVSDAVLNPGAIGLDAGLGMFGGFAGAGARAFQVSRFSSAAKGKLGEALFRERLESSGASFAEQVTVRGAGAKPRLDFVIDSGSSLSAVEVKTFGSPFSGSQQTVFDFIGAGNSGTATGTNAFIRGNSIVGKAVTSFDEVRYGAFDFVRSVDGAVGGGIAGGFYNAGAAAGGYLIYPNKTNTNMTRSVYSK